MKSVSTNRKKGENMDGKMIQKSVELRTGNWRRKAEYRLLKCQKQSKIQRKDDKLMSNVYSRYSRTLAPGTALIVRFDVCLHSILHHTADSTRHHISTPVPVSQTQTGIRKWQVNKYMMFRRWHKHGSPTTPSVNTLLFVSKQKRKY